MASRIIVIIVAIWTMIQALGYGAMAVLAILTHNCRIDMVDSKLSQMIYAIYFRDNECGPIDWSVLLNQQPTIQPQLPDITLVAFRTNAIAQIYVGLSFLWLVTSFMLIVGACINCIGKCGYYFLFHPWIYASLINILLDLVATGFFIYDLVYSFSAEELLNHLDVTNTDAVLQNVQYSEKMLPIPAVIMICASMRGFIIWLFNCIQIYIVVKMGKELVFDSKNRRNSLPPRHIEYISDHERSGSTQEYDSTTRLNEQNRYNDPVFYQYQNVAHEYGKDPSKTHQNPDQLSPKFIDSEIHPNIGPQTITHQHHESMTDDKSSVHMPVIRSNRISSSSTAEHQQHAIKKDYRSSLADGVSHMIDDNVFDDERRITIDRPHLRPTPPIRPNKPKKPRQSTASTEDSQQQQPRSSIVKPTDELRSQLPWSYFKSREDISAPKKTFQNLRVDEDLPPVPVPDYTLHFPKKDRPSKVSDDGSWSGPEYRY